MATTEKTDVVVVGSGASGSLLAAELAESGKSVLILEAGPERRREDMVSSQIWARRLKWGGPPTELGGKHPLGVAFNHGWGTGGAAIHHFGLWLRLHEDDFDMRSRSGRGLDWPISYEDLRPFYDEVQGDVGISGDAEAEVWRPPGEPYPMPPLPVFDHARLIERGFHELGLRTSPLPLAINSMPFKGRRNCIFDGWCDAGCPIDALVNPLVRFLPRALQAGATLQHDSFVTRVLTDSKGDRATGVEYIDAEGREQTQEADVVILAAFAIQNPRILLNSASGRHKNGLANSSGLVGRYLMTHGNGNVFALFDVEDTQSYMGVNGGVLLSQESYAKDLDSGRLNSSQWAIGNALKPNDLLGIANARPELFGDELHKFLETASRQMAAMAFFCEELPNPDNRVTLSGKRDRRRVPLARVVHEFGPDDDQCFDEGMKQGLAIMKAAGAYQFWHSGRATAHILGGTIMGRTSSDSVTNGYGRSHDVPNLVIAGPGLFPTSGGVNPTFTISALALRTARHLIENWSDLR